MRLYWRSKPSYDVLMTVWFVGILAVLSVTSAFSAVERGDRWRQARIKIDGSSEDQSPFMDGEGSRGLDGSPVAILANDEQRRSFDIAKYPRAAKRATFSDLRLNDFRKENSPKAEVDNKTQLHKDYVRVAGMTKPVVYRFRGHMPGHMPSSNVPRRIVVDILVVVDNELYRRILQRQKNNSDDAIQYIKTYYSYVISLVDSTYSRVEGSQLTIRVRLADFFIAQNRSDSPFSEEHVRQVGHSMAFDPNEGLDIFQAWLKENNETLPKHDHAMVFTGYTMITRAGEPDLGMAYIGTICKTVDGFSISIIQEDGGLSSVSTAVHELGHSLGAEHDGEGFNEDCLATANNIMSPYSSTVKEFLKNFFLFSECTIRQIKSELDSSEVDGRCLLDSVADEISVLPGQVVSPDDQCKDFYGQDSGLCNLKEFESPEWLCTRVWCLDPRNASNCVSRLHLTPVLGTPCDDGKVCKDGECLDKTEVLESVMGMGASAARTDRISTAQKRHHRSRTAIHKQFKQNSVDRNARRTQAEARAAAWQSSIRQVRPMP